MVKPTLVQGELRDLYLSCPCCEEVIRFPLIRCPDHIYDKRPKKCPKCGAEFDFTNVKDCDTINLTEPTTPLNNAD